MDRETILLVEDEADQILMVRMRLEASGFDVVTAMDARTGIELARRKPPSLILLDLVLQDADGLEVCQQFKRLPETKHVPLIIFTGSNAKDLEGLCRDAGAEGCLRKPYESKQLVDMVTGLIRETRRSARH